jgi:thiamine pyrophosphokinase
MSSHHIVKDKQEPALLIANGLSCKHELLEELLEWSPFVVVLDGAITRVVDLGIKVDVLLGDFDRNELSLEELKRSQYPIEIIPMEDQEKTDLQKGLEFLILRGFPAVNIIWATGLRMDHTLANVFNLVKYKNDINIVMFDDHSKIIPLKSFPHTYEKWYKAKTIISLLPMPFAEGIETQNLLYPLNKESLVIGERLGNSNEVENEGLVKIQYTNGNLFILECHD